MSLLKVRSVIQAAILDLLKIEIGKTRKLQIFSARAVKYDTIKHFAAFWLRFKSFYRKRVKNTHF